jgi:hypothetical protein
MIIVFRAGVAHRYGFTQGFDLGSVFVMNSVGSGGSVVASVALKMLMGIGK